MNTAIGLYQKNARRRTKMLVFILGLWTLFIVVRLLQLQVFSHSRLSAQVVDQNQRTVAIYPERGTIYDRNGKVLALSIPSTSVFYTPAAGEALDMQLKPIRKVQSILGLTDKDVEDLKTKIGKGSHFVYLKRKVDEDTASKVAALDLKGISFQEETKRFYPLGTLAAHVLGAVGMDNEGLGGVEAKYDAALRGKKGKQLILLDNRKRTYHFETIEEPQSGGELRLTLDSTIQYIAQKELEKSVAAHAAAWGTVIVADPGTGEILAMASVPTFDPNIYPPSDKEAEKNRAIHHLFEPGSTFKIVTASAALENRRVSLTQSFDCSKGSIETAGSAIRDHKSFGVLSFPDVIAHSSNVGTIQVGRQIGSELLYSAVKAFRFGEKTGVELPAEAAGIVHPPTEWSKRSLDSISIGYEISVTALQILQALDVIAERGRDIPPTIIQSAPGSRAGVKKRALDTTPVLSVQAAEALISILERAVIEGTGTEAGPKGYAAAGKTGTTQIYDPILKSYQSARHIASFTGFVPVKNPVLSMIVVLSEPKKDAYYGGQVAAPIFREIASRVLRYRHVYPQKSADRNVVTARLQKGQQP